MHMHDQVPAGGTTPGIIGGIRADWTPTTTGGWETRFAWSTGHFTDRLLGGEINCSTNTFFWDLDLLYYPWGDTRWRPYLLLGLGTSQATYYEDSTAPGAATSRGRSPWA